MSQQIAAALDLKSIFALIEAPGEFLEEVKSRELKRSGHKLAELKESYAQLDRLMQRLRGAEPQRRSLRDLFAHLPKLALPSRQTGQPFAPHELFLIKEFLYHFGNLRDYVRKLGWLDLLILPDTLEIFELLDPERSGLPSFRISAAFSARLGEIEAEKLQLLNRLKHARAQLLQDAQSELRLPQMKEEFVLSRSDTALAEQLLRSSLFVLSAESVANYTFLLADDELCLDLKKQLGLLAAKQEKEEDRVQKDLSRQVWQKIPLLRNALELASRCGWRFILADFGLNHGCCVPTLHRKRQIRIAKAVNLPLKLHLEASGRRYQALDYDFDNPISLLTGPNMGGKTSVLKTIGQACWLARLGIPIPCAKAELPLFDFIWYNQDDASGSADLSSFGREVVSFVGALEEGGFRLFLLDEFAKGTNPAEGELLASAVLRYLATTPDMCVAATHFTAPAMLESLAQYSVAGLDPDSGQLAAARLASPSQRLKALSEAMDYSLRRLKKHQAPPLSAISVARLLGLPEQILNYTRPEEK